MSFLNEYIKTFTNNDKMKNVFQLLYEENSFDILLQNWEISKRNSNVLEEINLFQYTLSFECIDDVNKYIKSIYDYD